MIVKAVNAHDGLLAENTRLRAELAEAVELLHRMIQDFHPFTSKRTSRSRFSDQLEGERRMSKQEQQCVS